MDTLHCTLENGADLYVNEHQKIRQYHARSTEERRKKKNAKSRFFYFMWWSLKCVIVYLARDVLRLWRISLIPTYRVYRLYDMELVDMKLMDI